MFRSKNLKLFVLSIFILFLELFLIRWISTEIRVFAYVSNLVLLACFIGIGAGCYFSDKKTNILYSFAALGVLILSVGSGSFKAITAYLSGFTDSVIWFETFTSNNFIPGLKGLMLTLFMFALIALVFVPLGQTLGALFGRYSKIIKAYSINIAGSIVGIWLFSLISFFYIPPWGWFVLAALMGLFFIPRRRGNYFIFCAVVIFSLLFILALPATATKTIWSPYQKLDVYPNMVGRFQNGYVLKVNNANYMGLFDISPEHIGKNFKAFNSGADLELLRSFNQYELAYKFKDNIKDVLIVGAGGGNDVAAALRQGASNIDAVEIDPGIYRFGLSLHPEKPYQDGRVNIIIDDARSFFKKSRKKYDLIVFGLLDAHASNSAYNNMRLDHYVYTLESFREAKALLKEDGIMSLSFDAPRDWIRQRLSNMLEKTFKKEPMVFFMRQSGNILGWGGFTYIISNQNYSLEEAIEKDAFLEAYIDSSRITIDENRVKDTVDDWPYVYLEKPTIPKMHLVIIFCLSILFIAGNKLLSSGRQKLKYHFFFLGAAFMLLEFQNISKSALIFGSTWMVNAYTISAILLLILCANLTIYFFKPKKIQWAYYLLSLSLIVLYFIPLNSFNAFNHFFKASFIIIFLNLPIFFAGLIFIYSFNKTAEKSKAFGSNLLGAAAGGLVESLSFIWGIKALLLVAFLFYSLSLFFFKREIEYHKRTIS